MHERLILATAAAGALVALLAIRNGALDAAAAVVLVGSLLLFVRAAFRLVDPPDQVDDEPQFRPGGIRHAGSERDQRHRLS